MEIDSEKISNVYIMKIKGRLAIDVGEDLIAAYEKIVYADEENKPKAIAFDCTGLTFIDSTGIGAVVRCMKNAISQNISLHLTNVTPDILKILKLAELNKFLSILEGQEFHEKYIGDDIDEIIDSI